MKLRLSFFLIGIFGVSTAGAQSTTSTPVTVSTWKEFQTQAANGVTDFIMESMESGSETVADVLSFTTSVNIKGALPDAGSVLTINGIGRYDARFGFLNFSNGGALSNVTITGTTSEWHSIIHTRESNLSISSCTFRNIKSANGKPINLVYPHIGGKFIFEDSTMKDNENVSIDLNEGSKILNSTFTNNKGKLKGGAVSAYKSEIIGSFFQGNSVVSGDEFAGTYGGAVKVLQQSMITDTSFEGNYTMQGSSMVQKEGGAIYAGQNDSSGPIDLTISAQNKDVTFSGNRVRVTTVSADNKPQDGYANAIMVATHSYWNGYVSVKLEAQASKSIEFFDPIVIDVNAYKNAQHDVVLNGAVGATGKVRFSGEKYQTAGDNDLSRMSRFSSTVGMTQEKGEVVITQRAVVGASLASTTETNATVGALNYVQKQGRLEISRGGHLMAGSYMVGDRAANSAAGFNGCTLSVGNEAKLTTGWVFIENGVNFDLSPYDTTNSGVVVKIVNGAPNSLLEGTTIYDESGPRISLNGVIGISNNLNYTEARWNDPSNPLEFLLFDFSDRPEMENSLAGDFTGIEIAGTGASGNSHGSWELKWDVNEDSPTTKNKLYAVWTAGASIPEPSSSALVMFGLGSLLMLRRRVIH